MGCLLALLARVALLALWFATPLVARAFQGGWVLPLLGLIFLPITTLVYIAVYTSVGAVTGWAWLLVALGVLFDLGIHSSGAYANRHRMHGRPSARGGLPA